MPESGDAVSAKANAEGASEPLQGRALWRQVWRDEQARLLRVVELFPFTPLGLAVGLGAYAALRRLAQAQLDLVWLVLGYAGLGLALLGPLAVLLAALFILVRGPRPHAADALRLETGTFADTGFALPLPWYLPLAQLRWEWLEPAGAEIEPVRAGGALRERVQMSDRGRFERIRRRLFVSDPFGLCRVALRMQQKRALDVLPRLAGLRHLPSLSAFASGDAMPHPMGLEDGDRLELRRYAKGDPARFIHWKVLSRTRKLMVRTPERALSVARRTAAFLVAGPDDDASAAIARLALERRLLGSDFSFGTDDELGGSSEVGAALDALMRSSRARERGGEGLWPFVLQVEREGPASLLVFAPSRPGAWLERVASVARRRKLRVLIGVDGVYERKARPLWRRLLALPRAAEGTAAIELEEVLRALGQAGAEVIVLDRGTGQRVGLLQRRAMLERVA